MGFRKTGIGPLPRDWKAIVLREICQKTKAVDPKQLKEFEYVDVSSISNERLKILASQRFTGEDAPSRARKPIQEGDILFATVRPSLRRVVMVPSDLDGQICSTAFCV